MIPKRILSLIKIVNSLIQNFYAAVSADVNNLLVLTTAKFPAMLGEKDYKSK